MKKLEEIKLITGKIVGYVETDYSGNKTVYTITKKILGYYKASSNTTTTITGRIIAYGDVTGLFFQDEIRI